MTYILILYFLFSCTSSKVIIIPHEEDRKLISNYSWENVTEGLSAEPYNYYYHTRIRYPELRGLLNKTVQDSINYNLKKDFFNTYNFQSYYYDYLTFLYYPNVNYDSKVQYTCDINYKVYVKHSDLLILFATYLDSRLPGGSRPSSYTEKSYYIDLKTGQFLSFRDMFKEGKIEEAMSVIETYMRKLHPDDEMYFACISGANFQYVPNKNYILGLGITYHCRPEINIPKKELTKLMKKEYRKLW